MFEILTNSYLGKLAYTFFNIFTINRQENIFSHELYAIVKYD